jgi:hypothetical protein
MAAECGFRELRCRIDDGDVRFCESYICPDITLALRGIR